jgi:hypothetical protein
MSTSKAKALPALAVLALRTLAEAPKKITPPVETDPVNRKLRRSRPSSRQLVQSQAQLAVEDALQMRLVPSEFKNAVRVTLEIGYRIKPELKEHPIAIDSRNRPYVRATGARSSLKGTRA